MKDKNIEVIKNMRKPKSVQDIQVFTSFVNFYKNFIYSFSMIAIPLISMLKTTKLFNLSATKMLKTNNILVVWGGGSRIDKTVKNLFKKSKNMKFKNLTYIRAMGKSSYLTPNAKKVFNFL